MAKPKKALTRILLLGGFVALAVATSCVFALKPVQMKFVNISIAGFGLEEAPFNVEVTVTNPNGFAVTVSNVEYRLYVENTFMAKNKSHESFYVPARQSVKMQLPLSINYNEVSQAAWELVKKGYVTYELRGTCVVSAGSQKQATPIEVRTRFDLWENLGPIVQQILEEL